MEGDAPWSNSLVIWTDLIKPNVLSSGLQPLVKIHRLRLIFSGPQTLWGKLKTVSRRLRPSLKRGRSVD